MNPQRENGRKSVRDNIDAITDKDELFRWTDHVKSKMFNANQKTQRRWQEALAKKAKELDRSKSKPVKK